VTAPPGTPDAGIDPANLPRSSVLVFTRTNDTWSRSARIDVPVPVEDSRPLSVALDRDRLVVGTGRDVRVFRRVQSSAGDGWTLDVVLVPDLRVRDRRGYFGRAVALEGETLLATDAEARALHVFERTDDGWVHTQAILQPGPLLTDQFGSALALAGDTAFVGNYTRPPGGAVFRYGRTEGIWTLRAEIAPADRSSSSTFGYSVAATARTAAFADVGQGFYRGAVYTYDLLTSLGEPCTSRASCASGFCVDGVCCDSACGGGADDCQTCAGPESRGSCAPAARGVSCRPAEGECDVAEACDGTSRACPADLVRQNGLLCSSGACVDGVCTAREGVRSAAPHPATPPPAKAVEGGCATAGRVGCRAGDGRIGGLASALLALLPLARRRRVRSRRARP
jgi:hypothetical protein